MLEPQRNTELALGYIMQAAFGTSTVIDGLTVTQQSSPNMTVQVGTGAIITYTTVDPTGVAFGSLPLNSGNLVKVGINTAPVNMTALIAPSTSGQSQNWLVEAQFLEADGSPVVLPYYDAATPTLPYTGPANAGTSQNTRRTNTVQLQWKAGTAAATGQQSTPPPDAGWVGVAVVTVANGQSSITNSSITPYINAPVVPTKLPFQRAKLTAPLTLYVSATGSDTNSGLAAIVPFATLQKAWNSLVTSYDLNGYAVTISVANGTYNTGLICSGPLVGQIDAIVGAGADVPTVSIVGNTLSPSSVTVSGTSGSAITVMNGARVNVAGMKLTASLSGQYNGNGIQISNGGYCVLSGAMEFGSCGFSHVLVAQSSTFSNTGTAYTISGGAGAHWTLTGCSNLILNLMTVTLSGTPAFSTGFANVTSCSQCSPTGMTFTGSATGVRYVVSTNGVIFTNGAGATYLPGGTSGSTATGGQYV